MTLGPLHDDLAVGARGHLDTIGAEDADLLTGERQSDGARAAYTVDRVDRRPAGRLRQSVALDEREAVTVLEPLQQLGRSGGGPADREPHRRGVGRARRSGLAANMA